MNDIVINKIQSIQRCVRRAREEYQADRDGFATNYTRQDAALLNVLRACETAIDLANHVIRADKLGIPVSSADSFKLLRTERIIGARLAPRVDIRSHICYNAPRSITGPSPCCTLQRAARSFFR